MHVTFRADASLEIGTGHVMRCMALATALTARGHECTFISRDLPGNLIAKTRAMGFATTALPAPDMPSPEPGPTHAAWAGVPMALDAAQSRAALPDRTDWLVLDHYAFDAAWARALRSEGTRLMVLDDLADRRHDCDLLVDQTLGRNPADYDRLVPLASERLVGPTFALLRPEFAAHRPQSLADRQARGFAMRHLLIFMGGSDLPDATGLALGHLADGLAQDHGLTRITVLTGPHAPAAERIRAQAKTMRLPCTVLSDVATMADLMAGADLCIGAAGGAAWERCTLGLPTLIVVMADNQRKGAAALAAAGAAIVLGEVGNPGLRRALSAALTETAKPSVLRDMSKAAAQMTDGLGLPRIIAAMEHPCHIRPATTADTETVWAWRQTLPPSAFLGGALIPLDQHIQWFTAALTDPNRHMLILQGDAGLGHIRLDLTNATTATISIVLAPDARGKGFGLRALTQAATWARAHGITRLQAAVHPDNAASLALFATAGYLPAGQEGAFHLLQRPL